jgi:acetate---CoA ligase (ADP-forming)
MDLERLLRPQSIAAIGGRYAAEVIRQCERMGFAGELWAVNPSRTELAGRPCIASIEALPAAPDVAFIGIKRELTIEAVSALAARGAGGAVAFASGFKEVGDEGALLQAALVEAAGAMPVLGPNCYGLINYLDGALLWPDQHGGGRCERGVALVVQSSNVAINLTMQRRALPIAYVVALGNQAVVGLADVVRALADDPRVSAIGLYIEGIGDPAAFQIAARQARAGGTPIVALKVGRSEAGGRLALSHTASLTGADAVVDAYFERVGVARVSSITSLLETLKLLHVHGPLRGGEIVSLSCSGGEAALIADAAHGRNVRLRPFAPSDREAIAATVHPLVTVGNPFDYHTFDWANAPRLRATFEAVLRARFDLAALIIDLPRDDHCDQRDWLTTLHAWREAAAGTGARSAVLASLPEGLPEPLAAELVQSGIAPLTGIAEAIEAIEAAAALGARLAEQPAVVGGHLSNAAKGLTLLEEAEAKALLHACGIAVPAGCVARSPDAAVEAAGALGYPVVVKLLGQEFAHKTERCALRLRLGDATAVRAAAVELLKRGERLLVETMVSDAVAELIIGVARDAVVGAHLVIGAGGVLAELIADRVVLLMPASAEEVRAGLGRLRVARLLEGHRGRPEGDLEAVVDAVLVLQRFALDHIDRLEELDINPLIVRPRGQGAVAVDALIRLRED